MNRSNELKAQVPAIGWMVGALAVVLGVSACIDPSSSTDPTTTPTQSSDTTQDGGLQGVGGGGGMGGGGMGGGMGAGAVLTIALPADTSIFPPGPGMPLSDADAIKCLPCHDGIQAEPVAELQSDRSPNFELVNAECHECHSADYALFQPPLDKAGWAKVVKKMGDAFDTTIVDGVPTVDVMFNPVHQDVMATYLTAINGK